MRESAGQMLFVFLRTLPILFSLKQIEQQIRDHNGSTGPDI